MVVNGTLAIVGGRLFDRSGPRAALLLAGSNDRRSQPAISHDDDVDGIAIRAMGAEDWPEVKEIYAAGIATGNATFETESPSWEAWDANHRGDLRFVGMNGTRVAGWVAAGAVSDRCDYLSRPIPDAPVPESSPD